MRPAPYTLRAAVAAVALAAPGVAFANGTFTVNGSGDSIALDSVLTLREAMSLANRTYLGPFSPAERAQIANCTWSAPDTVADCGAGGDQIGFAVARVDLTAVLPDITRAGTLIVGSGGVPRIDAGGITSAPTDSAVIRVEANNVALRGVTIVNTPGSLGNIADVWVRADGAEITDNFLGTLPDAAVANCSPYTGTGNAVWRHGDYGVRVWNPQALVAVRASLYGNRIGCHTAYGVYFQSGTSVIIGDDTRPNWIGVNERDVALPNTHGVFYAPGTTAGTLVNNVIDRNAQTGFWCNGCSNVTLYLNSIRRQGSDGVRIDGGATAVDLGNMGEAGSGFTPTSRGNVISLNGNNGVVISGPSTHDNHLYGGNFIGTDRNGYAQGNAANGVALDAQTHHNLIGPRCQLGAGGDGCVRYPNVVSGNGGFGVVIANGAYRNSVMEAKIGTNERGESVPNSASGVMLQGGANFNWIGGHASDPQAREWGNTIAFNRNDGIHVDGATTADNRIERNDIHHNTWGGIAIYQGGRTYIGTLPSEPDPVSARQFIYANGADGIWITATNAGQRVSSNNFIGVSSSGGDAGNAGNGVWINDSSNNQIFGMIRNNSYTGVAVNQTVSNGSRLNEIVPDVVANNSSIAIDLGNNGATLNDPGDADSGPNDLQNYPSIDAWPSGIVSGTTCAYCYVYLYRTIQLGTALTYVRGGELISRTPVQADAAGHWSASTPGLSRSQIRVLAENYVGLAATGNTSELGYGNENAL